MVQQVAGKSRSDDGPTVTERISKTNVITNQGIEAIVKVNGVQANFLVDTGASLTILRPDIYYNIPENSRPQLSSTDIRVAMANGQLAPCLGRGQLRLEFQVGAQSKTVTHDVYLADIEPEGILGYDFLQMYNCSLNLG